MYRPTPTINLLVRYSDSPLAVVVPDFVPPQRPVGQVQHLACSAINVPAPGNSKRLGRGLNKTRLLTSFSKEENKTVAASSSGKRKGSSPSGSPPSKRAKKATTSSSVPSSIIRIDDDEDSDNECISILLHPGHSRTGASTGKSLTVFLFMPASFCW